MNERALATYLNDHLAGSTTALWTATRLIGSHRDDAVGTYLSAFRQQLIDERAVIRSLLDRLPAQESAVKRTVGAVGAALMWARSALPVPGVPSLLEDIESLAIGVWGKRLLWGTMSRVAAWDERFADVDLDGLAESAEGQERQLLALRDDAIRTTLDVDGEATGSRSS
jgi:hypothetical protein